MLTDKQVVGNSGEDIASKFIVERGYEIIARNYRKPWGELDIIATRAEVLHFIEVKTVSCETSVDVSHGTFIYEDFHPEDNVHYNKRKRLARAIETYLIEKNVPRETPFQIDIVSVYVSRETSRYEIDFLEDVIL